jgi:zinc protease
MKEYVISYSKLWVQNLDRRLGYQLDSSFYQTEFFIDEIEKRLEAMSVDDVNRAVKKHLDRWDFTVAIVAANAAELAAAIESGAKSPITYQTPQTDEAALAEDELIEAFELPIESVSIVPVDELFEK